MRIVTKFEAYKIHAEREKQLLLGPQEGHQQLDILH